jgi:hypothetical protein
MIDVFFESKNHAEHAASFAEEAVYIACLPALEKIAKESNMIVTESDVGENPPQLSSLQTVSSSSTTNPTENERCN